jgi:inward rectifier potassium channel
MNKKNTPPKIIKKNAPERYTDLYHTLLKITWTKLFLVYILFFLSINAFFAFLYHLVPGSLNSTSDLKDAFFFSVQTFSTVGYGTVAPQNLYGNIIVVLEIMTGVVSMALSTGLVFSKFSRPSAKILYSENLLITTFDHKKVLMFRMANARSNQIISAKVELHRIFNSPTSEGRSMVRFTELKLIKNYSPIFVLSWTVLHPIDSESPFFGKSIEEIRASNDEFYVIISGNDGTFSQTIYDTHHYKSSDILLNHYFVDILHRQEDGIRVIDYNKFHQTFPHA